MVEQGEQLSDGHGACGVLRSGDAFRPLVVREAMREAAWEVEREASESEVGGREDRRRGES